MSITMTTGLPTWFLDQFSDTLYHVCQQKESKLAQAVRVSPVLGAEDKAFDMMDTLDLVQKTGRNVETPIIDPSAQRRWVSTTPYHAAVLYDKDDDLQMLLDPTSDYITGFRRAVNRKKDTIISAAFSATVQAGRRYGDSTVSWTDSKYAQTTSYGRVIAHDTSVGNANSADTGLTVEKLELAREYFERNDCDPDIPKFLMCNPIQITDMLGQQEVVSSDYNTIKALVRGEIPSFMGFIFIPYNGVTVGSNNDVDGDTDVYEVWCWAQDAIILGVADAISVDISTRNDRSNSQQVYVHMNMGAMRMDEDKICKIECS